MPKRPDLREFVLIKSTMDKMNSEAEVVPANGDSSPSQPKKAKVRFA